MYNPPSCWLGLDLGFGRRLGFQLRVGGYAPVDNQFGPANDFWVFN